MFAHRVDKRRFHDEDGKARAVGPYENRFMALPGQIVARQTNGLPLLVDVGQFRRPVGGRKAVIQQVFGRHAHHLAKSRVDVSDAARQVARAQAGDYRVFHRLAKSQCFAQVMLDFQAPTRVTAQ